MGIIRIKLGNCEGPVERECTGIECWYDRHFRHWVLYPIDAEGNQLDEARYGFGKAEATQMRRDMEAELIGKIY